MDSNQTEILKMVNELNNTKVEGTWQADLKQTLLSYLKTELIHENYSNDIEMAKNFEGKSIINAYSIQDYTNKSAKELARIYDSAPSSNINLRTESKNLNSPCKAIEPNLPISSSET